MKKQNKRSIKTIILLLSVVFIYKGLQQNLETSIYNIKSTKIKNDITVVQISDLHATLYNDNQDELVDAINIQKPDIIFITGDIMNEITPLTNVDTLIKKIKDIAPIYYVTGNHEYADSKLDELFDLLKKYKVNIMVDKTKQVMINNNKILISGLDDSEGYYYWQRNTTNVERLNNLKKDKSKLHLLLSHRPELALDYAKSGFDITYAGHAHGGQVRIPYILKGIIAPNQYFLPKYTKGVYNLDNNSKLVVSAGLLIDNKPRFYNKPNLVVTKITAE